MDSQPEPHEDLRKKAENLRSSETTENDSSEPTAVAGTAEAISPAFLSDFPRSHFRQDFERWKEMFETCEAKLQQLRTLLEAVEGDQAWDQAWAHGGNLRAEVSAASRTLSQEQAYVKQALDTHGAVLLRLLSRLQARDARPPCSRLDRLARQPSAGVPHRVPAISKEAIGSLKDLIREHEVLTAQVEAERVKYRERCPFFKDKLGAVSEDSLRRANSLLELRVKRLRYEMSRLLPAQAIEMEAVTKLLEQAAVELNLARQAQRADGADALLLLQEDTRFLGTDGAAKQACRHSSRLPFVDSLEDIQRSRQQRLELRPHSDRVYRQADLVDEQADALHRLAEELGKDMEEMNKAERTVRATWLALRRHRDELSAHLIPDQQCLQELKDIAKEKLELDTKLQKENFLFKKQLEDFQRDLLEVETDLLTGNINRRARATKNIVTQLAVLRDSITQQNAQLRRELVDEGLSVSPSDSLASAAMTEEGLRQHVTDKMKKMELRIKEDLDKRALFKRKKFIFEPAATAKVSFRGQRNVIKVPSKVADEWRRKTTIETRRQEVAQRQVETLRREILDKLGLEKERAKEQQLQHESESVAEPTAKTVEELRSILERLDAFLRRSSTDRERGPSSSKLARDEQDVEVDFGLEMRTLVLQLKKLQTVLDGGET